MWGETPQSLIDSLPGFCEKPTLRVAEDGDRRAYIKRRKEENGEVNLGKPFTAELGK